MLLFLDTERNCEYSYNILPISARLSGDEKIMTESETETRRALLARELHRLSQEDRAAGLNALHADALSRRVVADFEFRSGAMYHRGGDNLESWLGLADTRRDYGEYFVIPAKRSMPARVKAASASVRLAWANGEIEN